MQLTETLTVGAATFPVSARSFIDYRLHLSNVVLGCQELASCSVASGAEGGGDALRGVPITLRMRLQAEIWRCACLCLCRGSDVLAAELCTSALFLAVICPALSWLAGCRGGAPLPGASYEVLNEVVLSRGANPYLSKIDVSQCGTGEWWWALERRRAARLRRSGSR